MDEADATDLEVAGVPCLRLSATEPLLDVLQFADESTDPQEK
jgi:hypothetical protein